MVVMIAQRISRARAVGVTVKPEEARGKRVRADRLGDPRSGSSGAVTPWIGACDQASACSCTPATARPDGSAIAAKLASQAIAAGEEQAIDLPLGTVSAAA